MSEREREREREIHNNCIIYYVHPHIWKSFSHKSFDMHAQKKKETGQLSSVFSKFGANSHNHTVLSNDGQVGEPTRGGTECYKTTATPFQRTDTS